MLRRFSKARQDRGSERRKKDLALSAPSAFALVGVLFGIPPSSSAVPEPSTWVMLAISFAGLGLAGWVRQANGAARADPIDQRRRLGRKLPFGPGYTGWRRGRRMAAA